MKKSTNLEFTRFLAALLVIFSHSFPITMGNEDSEWFMFITNRQINMGGFAVALFFLCSGYLTMRSLEHNFQGILKYTLKRLKRMLPVLIFVVLICVIVGAFITTLSYKEYFTHPLTYRYLLNGVMIRSYYLPGVFEGSPYKPVVNGALWSLPVEFACNVMCAIGYKLKLLNKKNAKFTIPLVAVLGIAVYIGGMWFPIIRDIIRPCLVFYAGMLYYIYADKIRFNVYFLVGSVVLLIASSLAGLLYFGVALFLPYIFIYFWFNTKQHFSKISVMGKYTYAIYVWAFPIQQFTAMCFGWNMSSYLNAAISAVVTVTFAVITYYLIENPKKLRSVLHGK